MVDDPHPSTSLRRLRSAQDAMVYNELKVTDFLRGFCETFAFFAVKDFVIDAL